jgi:hypothetical protein
MRNPALHGSDKDSPRLLYVRRFYDLTAELERRAGGKRLLRECSGRMSWPQRGVYFFFEMGEVRTDSGDGPRVVRVGTHALAPGSRTSLWNRLSQHRGTAASGGGNHRGSIFRLIVGAALAARDSHQLDTWGKGSSAPAEVRLGEREHERRVSAYIGAMSFLWLDVGDAPGRASLRGVIERNAIALLSNYSAPPLDPPSREWLGHFADRPKVRASGLWNQNHVDEPYDPSFLDTLEHLVTAMNEEA